MMKINKINIRIAFLILFFSFFVSKELAGQTTDSTLQTINFNFFCSGGIVSIPLPSDFKGPEYHTVCSSQSGGIVSFIADDYCMVDIICGANTKIDLDKSYVPIDKKDENDILYYSKKKNKYAKITYLKFYYIEKKYTENTYTRRCVVYENASIEKKEILDKIFDSLKEKNN